MAGAMIATLLGAWVVSAQPASTATQPQAQPNAQQPAARPQGATLLPREVQQLFDALVLSEAQKQLQLSDTQYVQFIIKLKPLQEQRRENQRARNQLIQELRRLTQPAVQSDESLMREKLEALRQLELKAAEELQRGYQAIDQVLDLRQQARFRVFEELMEQRKLELLVRAREAVRQNRRANQATPPPSQ